MGEFDFSAHYKVHEYGNGIAWYAVGYATTEVEVEDSWTDDETGETFYSYDVETVEDPERVVMVMVGDDREFTYDVEDVEVIPDDSFCRDCGQIGCGCNVYV